MTPFEIIDIIESTRGDRSLLVRCQHGDIGFTVFYLTTGKVDVPRSIHISQPRWTEFYNQVTLFCEKYNEQKEHTKLYDNTRSLRP